MLVYVPSWVEEEVERHGLTKRLATLKEWASEGRRKLAAHVDIPMRDYLVYTWGRHHRLISQIRRLEGQDCLVLLELYGRGDAAYEKTIGQLRRGNTASLGSVADHEVIEWYRHVDRHDTDEATGLPQVPDELRPWLQPPRPLGRDDFVIYESYSWAERIRAKQMDDRRHQFREIVQSLVTGDRQGDALRQWPGVLAVSDGDRTVLYSEFSLEDRSVLFLLSPMLNRVDLGAQGGYVGETIRENHPFQGDEGDQECELDDLAPFAARSYPALYIIDEDIWLEIQRDVEGNLAFSAEEEDLLSRISALPSEGRCLPVFINGRAGSGKSTMLHHIFAAYYAKKQNEALEGRPLFLTHNERLVEIARRNCEKILSMNALYAESSLEVTGDFADSFLWFQDFARKHLPPSSQQRFGTEMRIGYPRFRRLYLGNTTQEEEPDGCRLAQRSKYSPDLVWHTIRTLIKGYTAADYMDPETYAEIPRGDQTVSQQVFTEIHDTIWSQWYKKLSDEKGYWDDQDMVRSAVQADVDTERYPAILCDEAQDFTRLDLRLLMMVSVFSGYELNPYERPALPIVLAGDPYQTTSPTGFRWDSAKMALHDELIQPLVGAMGVEIHFEELQRNYRSSPPIVKVGNLIQLWRHLQAGLPPSEPQRSWHPVTSTIPQAFVLDEDIELNDIRQKMRNTVILLPVERDEEADFVRNDPVLAELFPEVAKDPKAKAPKNVFSPSLAKGSEFDRVVLYGFGEYCPETLWQEDELEEGEQLTLEYYLNKLYVAATRARHHLFAIDTSNGYASLWEKASASSIDALRGQLAEEEWAKWADQIGPVVRGRAEQIGELQEEEPEVIADELRAAGERMQDPELLERAAGYYATVGDEETTTVCRARSRFFQRQYDEAARLFLKCGDLDSAAESLWRGMLFEELHALVQDNPHLMHTHEVASRLSAFMSTSPTDARSVVAISQFMVQRVESGKPFLERNDPQWSAVANELTRRMSSLSKTDLSSSEWRAVGFALKELHEADVAASHGLESAAAAYACSEDYAKAADIYEQAGLRDTDQFRIAKAKSVGMPQGLHLLAQLSDRADGAKRITIAWERRGGLEGNLGRDWLRHVAPSLEVLGRELESFRAYLDASQTDNAIRLFERAVRTAPREEAWSGLQDLAKHLLRESRFDDAARLVAGHAENIAPSPEARSQLAGDVVQAIAQSDLEPSLRNPNAQLERFINSMVNHGMTSQNLEDRVIGAALERAGRLLSALEFYEEAEARAAGSDKDYLRTRWVACKQRQVEYAQVSGQPQEVLEQRSQELQRQVARWGMRIAGQLPRFPDLAARMDDAPQVHGLSRDDSVETIGPGRVRAVFGALELVADGSKRLLLITDQDDLTTLRVDVGELSVEGTAEFRQVENGADLGIYGVPQSGYRVELRPSATAIRVGVKTDERTIEVEL